MEVCVFGCQNEELILELEASFSGFSEDFNFYIK